MESKLDKKTLEKLCRTALEMRKMSYIPYSHFAVGAGLITKKGKIYTGCNIENSTFTPTNCAERTAIFKAVSEGDKEFAAICIAGGKQGEDPVDFCPPCGVCRQVMSEFCDADFEVILVKSVDEYQVYTLEQILPLQFTLYKG